MQFHLLLWPYGKARQAMRDIPAFEALEVHSGVFAIQWPSIEFDVLKENWSEWKYIVARIECSVPNDLLVETMLFEVWKMENAYGISSIDQEYFQGHAKNGPLLKDADPGVRYFSEVRLTRPQVRPMQISSLDAVVPVNFINHDEARVWSSQKFSGLEFGRVCGHREQKIHEDASLIVPTNVMSSMVRGQNVFMESFVHHGIMNTHPLIVGFLTYEEDDILQARDFNFTREPICNYGYSQVLVSRKFVDFYRKRGLTGWVFRPILVSGSVLHREFAEMFNKFMVDWRTGHPDNRFSGP